MGFYKNIRDLSLQICIEPGFQNGVRKRAALFAISDCCLVSRLALTLLLSFAQFERRIHALEEQKAALLDNVTQGGKPLGDFGHRI